MTASETPLLKGIPNATPDLLVVCYIQCFGPLVGTDIRNWLQAFRLRQLEISDVSIWLCYV